jgi:Hypothetical glycosyl hydrolase family 15
MLPQFVRGFARARALSVAAVALAVIVSGPDPASATPPIGFNRTTFAYTSALPAPSEARRYQVMILQATDAAMVPILKAANPSLKIFVYLDSLLTRPGDVHGLTTCVPYPVAGAHHPDWFLVDQHGTWIPDWNYPGNYLMDVGNAAYQRACASHAVTVAKSGGFDGIYLDDIAASIASIVPPTTVPPLYRTPAAWRSAEFSFVQAVASQVHAHGVLVVGNLSGAATVPGLWQQWSAPLDGSGDEQFGEAVMFKYWSTQVDNAVWSEAHGKLAIMHTHDVSEADNTFGLASLLLAAAGSATWSTSNADYIASETWYPEYTTAIDLGMPTAAYDRLFNGLYSRLFAHGLVVVNASRARRCVDLLGGTYSGSGLRAVSSTCLGARSARILLADSAGQSVGLVARLRYRPPRLTRVSGRWHVGGRLRLFTWPGWHPSHIGSRLQPIAATWTSITRTHMTRDR